MLDFPDWSSPDVIQNPFPHYENLRKRGSILWDERYQFWTVFAYEDASAILRDSETFTVSRIGIYEEALKGAAPEILQFLSMVKKWVIYQDGPEHQRTRGPLVKALGASVAKGWKPQILVQVDKLLDDMLAQGNDDFVTGLAYPLPMAVIMAMLGLPAAMGPELKALTTKMVNFIDKSTSVAIVTEAAEAHRRLFELFMPIIHERRKTPGDDLISLLIKLQAEHRDFTDDDVVMNSFLLMGAGHETTTSLLTNGLAALLRHPEQLKALKTDPSLINSAVEEMLRFDPPVHRVGRMVTRDVTFAGKDLKKGQRVIVYLAAANRDEACVERPLSFDIQKSKIRHLSFSGGNHFCAGAQFARLEAQIAIQRLLERFPNVQMKPASLSYFNNFTFHCLTKLPLQLT